MTVEQEASLKKKVLRGNWGIAKDKASIHASMEKVQSYEEAFAKIQAATGISDIDELVTTFINAEDQNFALFNYVNELNGECEKLEEQVRVCRMSPTRTHAHALRAGSASHAAAPVSPASHPRLTRVPRCGLRPPDCGDQVGDRKVQGPGAQHGQPA